jgi:hypothetical protein
MEGLMQSNVIPIEPKDDGEQEAVDSFDALYCQYLKAQARFADNSLGEEAMNRGGAARTRLVWEIIKTRTVRQYQIAHKLKVLRELLEGGAPSWTDCRERMLLESIRMDVGEE